VRRKRDDGLNREAQQGPLECAAESAGVCLHVWGSIPVSALNGWIGRAIHRALYIA
jgi:hypothetical protein